MSPENKRIIKEEIDSGAKIISGTLPLSRKHPKGRNAYAHIPKVIKSVYGVSYTELDDSELENILEIIRFCVENPF